MKTEKLVVVDFTVQDVTIHIYDISPNVDVNDSFLKRLGHNPDTCSWAFGTKAEVIKHKGTILK